MKCGCDSAKPYDSQHRVTEKAGVLINERLAEGIGLLVLAAPGIASEVMPGQFVHLRITTGLDPLLRRPFSVYRTETGRIEILYQVLGRGTRLISLAQPGDEFDLIGPLGSGWCIPDRIEHALLVGGGLGAAPLGMLAEELARIGCAVTVALGAPTADRIVGGEVLEAASRKFVVTTDDGSVGEAGYVTQASERLLSEGSFDVVYVCGPEVMAHKVAKQAEAAGIDCQVSLERLMAYGVGACLSYVVSTNVGLKRACVDGPVFDAKEVCWDESEIPPKH